MEFKQWRQILPALMAAALSTIPIVSVQADPRPEVNVWLMAEDFGGYSCTTNKDSENQCNYRNRSSDPNSPDFAYYSQNVVFFNDQQNTIVTHPFENYQFASVTVSQLDGAFNTISGTTVNVTSNSQPFTFLSSSNTSYTFTWSIGGDLIIPANIPRLEIAFKYLPVLTLTQTENGMVCIDGLGLDPLPCSNTATSEIEFDNYSYNSFYNPQIWFYPGSGYRFGSITITIGDQSATTTSNTGSLSVPKSTSGNWVFTWENGYLAAPALVPSFQVSATFNAIPPPREGPSLAQGVIHFNSSQPFQINSGDPAIANDYYDINAIWLEIRYLNQSLERETCRFNLDEYSPHFDESIPSWSLTSSEELGEDSSLDLYLPPLQDIVFFCPGYHKNTPSTEILIDLFDDEEIAAEPNAHVSAEVSVLVTVDSPPAIMDVITEGEYEFGDELTFEVSNKDSIKYLSVEVLSNRFGTESCVLRSNKRDLDGNFIAGAIDADNNFHHQLPSFDEINTQCAASFITGQSSIDPLAAHTLIIRSLDQHENFERYAEIQVQPHSSPTPPPVEPTPPPVVIPQFSPPIIPSPQSQERQPQDDLSKQDSDKSAAEIKDQGLAAGSKKVEEIVVKTEDEIANWCTKKGIWIYTQSGILKMCDPINKVSLEIPACAGKEKTPTYPWVFRAQRFISGVITSKSGVELHNAVFFYKGLAISGSDEVSDQPCSNGSVFIPMAYSKTVFNFAKEQKPLIWVKQQ